MPKLIAPIELVLSFTLLAISGCADPPIDNVPADALSRTTHEIGATCGNGVVDPGEACDDGNASGGDGCSESCSIETGYVCRTPGGPCRSVVCSADAIGDEAFMRLNFIEVGVGSGGFFGTTGNSPAGYHARPSQGASNPNILGYLADPDDTQWTDYHGDFFVPGSPVEGWGIEIGGAAGEIERIATHDFPLR